MDQLDRWIALMSGPGFEGYESRDGAIDEIRALGIEKATSLLEPKLRDSDIDIRCNTVEALLLLDARRGVPLVLPFVKDMDDVVRWHVCLCLHDFGDERAVEPLIQVMQSDTEPHVRGTAAYALGGIGCPASIPALLHAMESDHEEDMHGHSASSCAMRALDDILGTNETRIRVSNSTCRLQSRPPDLKYLKERALAVFREFSAQQSDKDSPR